MEDVSALKMKPSSDGDVDWSAVADCSGVACAGIRFGWCPCWPADCRVGRNWRATRARPCTGAIARAVTEL
jgi:hypothetical protein